MMKTRTIVVSIALAAMLLGGCRSTRKVVVETVPEAVPTVQREYTVANFTATLEGVSATGQMRMAEDSIIWVSVSKLVELGRAMATVDSVWVTAPMAGVDFAGTYDDLSRRVGRTVTFVELQDIARSDNISERVVALVRELGFDATVSIRPRQRVERLSFPFHK